MFEPASRDASTRKLYITDSHSGATHEILVRHNAIWASDLAKIQNPERRSARGLRIVDETLRHVATGMSQITYLDAERGRLYYRGHEVIDILGKKSYEETCYCLIWGEYPSPTDVNRFREDLYAFGKKPAQVVFDVIEKLPRDAPPVTMVQAGIAAMLGAQSSTIPAFIGKEIYIGNMSAVDLSIKRTLASAQLTFAMVYCHRQAIPFTDPDLDPCCSFVYNLLLMMGMVDKVTKRPSPRQISRIEKILLVYADHEMSCATFIFLTMASTHADPLSCYLAGLTALYGINHGGALDATYHMMRRVGSVENVPALIAAVKRGEQPLYGFGHRIYKERDPRAQMLFNIVKEVEEQEGTRHPLLAVAEEIERAASGDDYFQTRGISINADFYMNFACMALGLPQDMVFLLVAFSRLQGFLAHWRQYIETSPRIIRPSQVYVGSLAKRPHKL